MSDHVREFREQRRVKDIRWLARDRKIDVLCHFTRLENLTGILRNGLLSRRTLSERHMRFYAVDHDRLDGCLWLAPMTRPRNGKNKVHPDGCVMF